MSINLTGPLVPKNDAFDGIVSSKDLAKTVDSRTAATKTTPVDADEILVFDSADSNAPKIVTFDKFGGKNEVKAQTIGGGTGTVGLAYYLSSTDTWTLSDKNIEASVSGQVGVCSAASTIMFAGLITLVAHGLTIGKSVLVGDNGNVIDDVLTLVDGEFVKFVGSVVDVDTIKISLDEDYAERYPKKETKQILSLIPAVYHADIIAGTSTVDCSAYIEAAIIAGGVYEFPAYGKIALATPKTITTSNDTEFIGNWCELYLSESTSVNQPYEGSGGANSLLPEFAFEFDNYDGNCGSFKITRMVLNCNGTNLITTYDRSKNFSFFFFERISGVTISNNEILDARDFFVFGWGCDNYSFEDNYVHDCNVRDRLLDITEAKKRSGSVAFVDAIIAEAPGCSFWQANRYNITVLAGGTTFELSRTVESGLGLTGHPVGTTVIATGKVIADSISTWFDFTAAFLDTGIDERDEIGDGVWTGYPRIKFLAGYTPTAGDSFSFFWADLRTRHTMQFMHSLDNDINGVKGGGVAGTPDIYTYQINSNFKINNNRFINAGRSNLWTTICDGFEYTHNIDIGFQNPCFLAGLRNADVSHNMMEGAYAPEGQLASPESAFEVGGNTLKFIGNTIRNTNYPGVFAGFGLSNSWNITGEVWPSENQILCDNIIENSSTGVCFNDPVTYDYYNRAAVIFGNPFFVGDESKSFIANFNCYNNLAIDTQASHTLKKFIWGDAPTGLNEANDIRIYHNTVTSDAFVEDMTASLAEHITQEIEHKVVIDKATGESTIAADTITSNNSDTINMSVKVTSTIIKSDIVTGDGGYGTAVNSLTLDGTGTAASNGIAADKVTVISKTGTQDLTDTHYTTKDGFFFTNTGTGDIAFLHNTRTAITQNNALSTIESCNLFDFNVICAAGIITRVSYVSGDITVSGGTITDANLTYARAVSRNGGTLTRFRAHESADLGTDHFLYSAGGYNFLAGRLHVGGTDGSPNFALTTTGAVTALSFTGAGTGLTGTASSLSIGGNAATSTAASTTTVTGGTSSAERYVTFGNTAAGDAVIQTDATFRFNPFSNVLSVPSVTTTTGVTVPTGNGSSSGLRIGSAYLSANVTAANLDTLAAGSTSNANSLHAHGNNTANAIMVGAGTSNAMAVTDTTITSSVTTLPGVVVTLGGASALTVKNAGVFAEDFIFDNTTNSKYVFKTNAGASTLATLFNSGFFLAGSGVGGPSVVSTGNSVTITNSQSPASGGTGATGEVAWDASYIYVCTATNTWKRAALTGSY